MIFSLLLLLFVTVTTAAAPVTFTVGFLDGTDQSPIVCATDGSDCVKEFTFPDTTRFWIDVPPTYAATIEISPVQSGSCKIDNDAYVFSTLVPNSLASFQQATGVLVLAAKSAANSVLVAYLPNCAAASGSFQRYFVGVRQNGDGWFGACPTGRFRLRVADASGACGVRRDDSFCYEGQRSCQFVARNGGAVKSDLSVGDGWRCCPRLAAGESDSITSTTGCRCGGGTAHVSLAGLRPPQTDCSFLGTQVRMPVGKDFVLYCDPTRDFMISRDNTPAIGATKSGTKFKVYFVDAADLRVYRSGVEFSCGYTGCGNTYTDAWSRLVPLASFRGAPLMIVIQCVSASGGECVLEAMMYERYRSLVAAVPGGLCEASDFCRKKCGITSGQCCADCSAADSCAECPMLPPTLAGGGGGGGGSSPSPLAPPQPPAVPATPAGTCQSGSFCRDRCGVTGGISASGISFGACCADCRPTDLSLTGGGLGCSNTCPAFGVGTAPSPVVWVPQPTTAVAPLFKTTTTLSGNECSNCDCAKTECEARCKAEGGGTVQNHACSARNGAVVSQICQCQPGSDGAALAVLTVLHMVAFVYTTCC